MKNEYRRSVPPWLKDLPAGSYTIQQVCDLCNYEPRKKPLRNNNNLPYNYFNILVRFKILRVDKELVYDENRKQVTKYEWLGADYYINKFSKENNRINIFKKNRVPAWLRDIPKGYYTINELASLSSPPQLYANVYHRLNKLNVEKLFVKESDKLVAKYNWPGVEFYENMQ